jgi:outer membrane protein assembly factor BamB
MVDHGPVMGEELGLVFLGDLGGKVHAVDMILGTERWSVTVGGEDAQILTAPAYFPGNPEPSLFVATEKGILTKLRADSGEEVWKIEVQTSTIWGNKLPMDLTPAGDLVLVTWGKNLRAFPTGDEPPSRPAWFASTQGGVFSQPLVHGDKVVAAHDGGVVLFLRRKTGEQIDRIENLPGIQIPLRPVALSKRRFLLCDSKADPGRMVAVEDTRRGFRVLWTYEAPTRIMSAPQVADDNILFGGADGYLYAIGVD